MRVTALICLILVMGCNKPLTHPEENDPIYRDLVVEAANAEKEIGEREKKVEEAQAKLKEIVPQRGQTRRFYSEYFNAKKSVEEARQNAEYLRVRAKSRKFEARAAYLEAFNSGKEWPNPEEYRQFELNRKLRSAPKSWRQRYPAEEAKPPEKKAESSGH